MKKVFLATSFSHQVDPATGQVLPDFRNFVEDVLKGLREMGDVEIFCAMEHEGWQLANDPPELGVQQDLSELEDAEIIVALLHDTPSVGVEFELGYALGKNKKVVVAVHSDHELEYFNQGLVSSGLMTYVTYDNVKYLVAQLDIALNTPSNDTVSF